MYQAQWFQEGRYHWRATYSSPSPLLGVFFIIIIIINNTFSLLYFINTYFSLLENVRVRRAGFANRQTYERFAQRYANNTHSQFNL